MPRSAEDHGYWIRAEDTDFFAKVRSGEDDNNSSEVSSLHHASGHVHTHPAQGESNYARTTPAGKRVFGPTSSFIEQFDNATIDEQGSLQSISHSGPVLPQTGHIHTPPPTRDSSFKRKLHGDAPQYDTPPSIISRRLNNAPEQWFERTPGMALPLTSPFNVTPMKFTPWNPYDNGPATAPAMSRPGLLWESASRSSLPMNSSFADDPFVTQQVIGLDTQKTVATPFDLPGSHPYLAAPISLHAPDRPRSASPAGGALRTSSAAKLPIEVQQCPGHVDPSLVCPPAALNQRPRSSTVSALVVSRRPYQFQLEQSRKDKTDKSRTLIDVSPSDSRSVTPLNRPRLQHRSMTDSRVRQSCLPQLSSFPGPAGKMSSAFMSDPDRDESPLKRHKSDAKQKSTTLAHQRNSVVLHVDEDGMARPRIVSLGEEVGDSSPETALMSRLGSEHSSVVSGRRMSASSQSHEPPVSPANDALESLREVFEDRQRRKQGRLIALSVRSMLTSEKLLKPRLLAHTSPRGSQKSSRHNVRRSMSMLLRSGRTRIAPAQRRLPPCRFLSNTRPLVPTTARMAQP
ncbi:hypothetical protein MRB53_041639 [Persea americana]|nr:hypothetical protein MRB53_041639 [Persea americana]